MLLCSGFSEKINAKTGADLQVDAILMKPVDKVKMAKTIRTCLKKNA